MGIFSKKTKKKDDEPEISPEVANLPWVKDPAVIVPYYGDPLATAFNQALETGEWERAARMLHDAPPAQRSFALAAGSNDAAAAMETCRRWMAEWPDDPLGQLTSGWVMTHWAWAARGSGRASTVEEEGWRLFFERLQEADLLLRQAARALPADPLPWAFMITTGRGLQIPLEESSARFDEAHRRSPWDPVATQAMLQNLCKKWSGSHRQMYDFARMAATECPVGSPAASSMPMAYIEEAIDDAQEMSIEQAVKKVFTPGAANDIALAAERSIFHPSFVADGEGLGAANVFLMGFFWCSSWQNCDRTLRVLQGRYGESPFNYIGDAGRMCRKVEVLTARNLTSITRRP